MSALFCRKFVSANIGSLLQKRGVSSKVPHFATLYDLNPAQINTLVKTAIRYKNEVKVQGKKPTHLLPGSSVALLFSKRSTRTRVATETASNLLGAKAMYLASTDIQLGVNESLQDTTRVLSSMVDCIVARVNSHQEIEDLVKYSSVPVINALSDKFHPTQILADLMTLHETYTPQGKDPQSLNLQDTLGGRKVAWVGDGNNVLYSLMITLPKFGVDVGVSTPKGYDPRADIVQMAQGEAKKYNTKMDIVNSTAEAIKDSDVIVTDTWISMGQEEEKADRLRAFSGYQVTQKMIAEGGAKSDWKFLHCLPRKSEEVDDDVFYSNRSLVFPEAENRKWTIMAVLDALLVHKKFPEN
ncbi:ornithine carbamoyltransferase [Entomophthora muscae]|uniref:Ornithine carbamoyltransferase n=2 Tax=Entomophthora muscae TaxID=34485 RepID=A0ACC2SYV1_9FUNG|nr:ornithine carbamoyltransferase [Entomophthora muscae]